MKCLTCGQELQDGMQFCFRCGAEVSLNGEGYGSEKIEDETVPEEKDQQGTEISEPSDSSSDASAGDTAGEDKAEQAEASVMNGMEQTEESEDPLPESPVETPEDSSKAMDEDSLSGEAVPTVPTPIPLTRLRSALAENAGNTGEEQGSGTANGPVITFRDLREKLFDAGGSGLMLLLCILSTTQIILSFLAGVVSFITSFAAAIKAGRQFGGEITLSGPSLFAIAGVVLLWILYAKCRKHSDSGISGILVALRVFMIINAVSAAIGAAMILFGAVLYAFIPAGMLFASRLGSLPPEGFPVWILVAIEPILLFSAAVCALLAVYYGKAAVFFHDVRSVFTEKIKPIRTGFLRFFCWLQVVTGALSALISMALFGSGRAVVRLLSSIPDLMLPPEAAARIVTSVAVVAVVSAVLSLITAVLYFVKERLFKAASDVTGGIFDPHRV